MMKDLIPTPVCNKCGKTAPIVESMSTPDWKVYRLKEPCDCGGTFVLNTEVKNDENN